MHYVGFRVFREIGLVCWQVYRQYFHPSVERHLVSVRHTDGLGFSDVTTSIEPRKPLVQFFGKTLPSYGDTFLRRFEAKREVLHRYAIDKGLERDLPTHTRAPIYEGFHSTITPAPEEDEEEAERYDEPQDYPPDDF
jgi:hypothetical protein